MDEKKEKIKRELFGLCLGSEQHCVIQFQLKVIGKKWGFVAVVA